MTVGENIKKFRLDKKLTQKELGGLLGVSQAMIGQYESGLRNPKRETAQKIAGALGVSVDDILSGNLHQIKEANHYREQIPAAGDYRERLPSSADREIVDSLHYEIGVLKEKERELRRQLQEIEEERARAAARAANLSREIDDTRKAIIDAYSQLSKLFRQ